MRAGFFVLSLAALSCNCNPKLTELCGVCPEPDFCQDGKCVHGCKTDADCMEHYACFSGICLCADSTCIDTPDGGGGSGGGGVVDSGAGGGCFEGGCGGGPDGGGAGGGAGGGSAATGGGATGGGTGGGVVDAGCPSGEKSCNGACVSDATCCNCCYQCDGGQFYFPDAYCTESQVEGDPDGGACPDGFSHTSDCAPCWDCRTINTYCPTQGCCGNVVDSGVVNGGCTCYGCTGFAYEQDKNLSCEHAQFYSHDGGPPEPDGGLRFSPCIWPQPGETAFCGYYPGNSCTCFLNHCGGVCAL